MSCCWNTWAIALALVILLGTFLYSWFHKRQQRKSHEFALTRNVKWVHMPSLFTMVFKKIRLDEMERELVKKHGKVFGASMFFAPGILVAEPEIAQIVFSKEFTNFTNRRVCFLFVSQVN